MTEVTTMAGNAVPLGTNDYARTDTVFITSAKLTYDELVSRGLQCTDNEDTSRWTLGALASVVETEYGKKTLRTYAGDIKRGKSTVYEARDVFRTFSAARNFDEFRVDHQGLSWTHYRHTFRHMSAAGLSLERALELLELADEQRWKPEMYQAELIRETGGAKAKAPRLARVCRDVPARITNMGDNLYELEFDDAAPYTPVDSGRYFVTISRAIQEETKP